MERRVKERLIGATILVVLVVMFVPEFLSGPHAPVGPADPGGGASIQTYTVDTQHIATELPAPAAPASTPPLLEPASSAAAPATPAATSAPAANLAPPATLAPAAAPAAASAPAARLALPPRPVPATKPTPATQPAPAPRGAAVSPGWAVQAGSFASKVNADRLVRELKAEGFSVYVAPIGAGANTRYRVRLGPLADRSAAAAVMAKLQTRKHASTLVPPSE